MMPAFPAPPDLRVPPSAGVATRFAAWLIDLGMCFAVLMVFNTTVRPWWFESAETGQIASAVLFFLVPVVYGLGFEACWGGRTPGKRWLRLRVADARGGRLAGWQIVVRNALRVVDALPQLSLVGGVSCVVTARTQRLGDLAARTVVVRDEERGSAPGGVAARGSSGQGNLWREHPRYAARLRERIGSDEAVLALRTLWRRDALDAAAREEIFGQLAARFRRAVPPPPGEWRDGGPGDEAFVQQVIEVLFDPDPGS